MSFNFESAVRHDFFKWISVKDKARMRLTGVTAYGIKVALANSDLGTLVLSG
jgi:hypothetical protein